MKPFTKNLLVSLGFLLLLLIVVLILLLISNKRVITFKMKGNVVGGKHYQASRSKHTEPNFSQELTMYGFDKDGEIKNTTTFAIKDNDTVYNWTIGINEKFGFMITSPSYKHDVKAFLTDVVINENDYFGRTKKKKQTNDLLNNLAYVVSDSEAAFIVTSTVVDLYQNDIKRGDFVRNGELLWKGLYREK